MFPTSRRFERWPLRGEHANIESELPKTVVASTLEPLIHMAELGMGIAYVPDFAINRQLREGLLVPVLDDYTDRSGPLRVLCRRAGNSLRSSEHSWTFSPRTLCHPSKAKQKRG
jgi:DNA-binding transcriptional LysR family regulator